ncbi:hypothetical protein SAMN05421827_11462 [Pedobacter terrae]|uniref:MG2 domain-containing protein n=1 Tax=Pedobacter terrae TaxID=405671 RepID=A0A1G7YR72_9SPHI|nr:hypothetical protein [Pedobacter terrae]SDG99072.1 hypothetical protein SAMN05421827_11462 [Pedobacter terrae]
MLSKFQILLACIILLFVNTKAQDVKLDSVVSNINRYGIKTAQSNLFVHFDKNIYTNNDQVWFSGYLLKTITSLDQYHTLYLSLINNSDSSVVIQEKFLIEKGFAFGALTLPDSLPSGSYRFVANTNIKKDNQPEGEFVQSIIIKSTTVNPLTANVSIFKAYDEQSKNGTALLKILSSDNRFVENAEIKYQIGKDKQTLLTGTAKSNVIGELMINFPADKITGDNNQLNVSIKKGKDIRYIKFNLPVRSRSNYQIQFYPEGGYLVDCLTSKVGFEIKDLEGTAIKATAILYENDRIIDTLQSNSTGLGSFSICPKPSKKYYVKLFGSEQEGISYHLPAALKYGAVLTAGTAIAENDFRLQLVANNNQKVHVLVHNFADVFLHADLILAANKTQNIRFKLDSVPIGLNTVTILDSNDCPMAERIFFAHYDQLNQIELSTDKNEYSTRDQVNLKLNVTGKNKAALTALVSISCTQANRISVGNNQNIIDYFYLQQHLKPLPSRSMGLKYVDQDYLNDILLVKTWSRYKWPEAEVENKEAVLSSFEYHGEITRRKKAVVSSIGLTTIAGESLNFLNTDSTGRFNIPYDHLLIKDPKIPVWLGLVTDKYDQYELKIDNPHDELAKYIVKQKFELPNTKADVLNSGYQSITSTAGIKLKEVVITKKNQNTDYAKGTYNKCGDYVCRYNILNCQNHVADADNSSPVTGEIYSDGKGGKITYKGCLVGERKPNITILKGINLAKEFYVSDITNKNEPINFSTVYWNYQMMVNGETAISFNTGDLTGDFKIVLQGVTNGGVVYGEKEIIVKSK